MIIKFKYNKEYPINKQELIDDIYRVAQLMGYPDAVVELIEDDSYG